MKNITNKINKKILLGLILTVFLFFCYSLIKQVNSSLQANYRLEKEVKKLTYLQEKNKTLKKRLEETQSLAFIEAEARDRLNLAREGETVFLIPDSEIERALSLEKKVEEIKLPYWQGWLKLFWK